MYNSLLQCDMHNSQHFIGPSQLSLSRRKMEELLRHKIRRYLKDVKYITNNITDHSCAKLGDLMKSNLIE